MATPQADALGSRASKAATMRSGEAPGRGQEGRRHAGEDHRLIDLPVAAQPHVRP